MRVPVWKQKSHWLLEWAAVQISQLGRSEVSHWGLVPRDESLGAGREQFALSLVGGVTAQPGVLAGPQMFSDGSSRIYRISLQKFTCLRSNQELPLQSWCCWSWWQCLLNYVYLVFFCKYSVSTGAGVMVCSVYEVTDLVRHSVKCFSGTFAV